MTDRDAKSQEPTAQNPERATRKRAKAQLRKAKAESRPVEVELEPQGMQMGAEFVAKMDAKAELHTGMTMRERRGRGRPPKSETARKARKACELAARPEFQHPAGVHAGKPHIAEIARKIPWNEPAVSRALKRRHK